MEEMRDTLKKCYDRLLEKQSFKPGEIVQWKDGLKNRRWPAYNQLCIVLDVFEKPIFDEKESPSTPYFREPLDILFGFIDSENYFVGFHFDSRRFEPYKG